VASSLQQRAVGLFGGTFDPVHQGHLDLARHVLVRCQLDEVLFIPAPQPPHKHQPIASYEQRLAMLEAALHAAGDGRLRCSRIEADLPSPSYTVRTVEALRALGEQHDYFLVIGADSLVDLPHWYRAEALLAAVNLIVVRRDHLEPAAIAALLAQLDRTYRFDPHQGVWRNQQGRSLRYLDDLELPISSSLIRRQLALGEVPSMLPPPVLDHIRQHHLYGWQDAR